MLEVSMLPLSIILLLDGGVGTACPMDTSGVGTACPSVWIFRNRLKL